MWPGEYPPEGRANEWTGGGGPGSFNVAGGVSPGRSAPLACPAALAIASMWPGEYPPEGRQPYGAPGRVAAALQCGRGSIPRKVEKPAAPGNMKDDASMWPGEYPPEGRWRRSERHTA